MVVVYIQLSLSPLMSVDPTNRSKSHNSLEGKGGKGKEALIKKKEFL